MTEDDIDYCTILNVLSDFYLTPPTRETLTGWSRALEGKTHDAVTQLREAVDEALRLDDAGLSELQTEYARLFVGPAALPCPPWESVYTSPNRLMMQEAFDALQELHAEAGLSLGQTGVFPDHIGAELQFLALLLQRIAGEEEREPAGKLADRLLDDHLNRWVGPFTEDVERSARVRLYKTAARATQAAVSRIQE